MNMKRPRFFKLFIILAGTILGLWLLFNLAVLPPLAAHTADRVAEQSGIQIKVGRLWYWPLAGLFISEVDLPGLAKLRSILLRPRAIPDLQAASRLVAEAGRFPSDTWLAWLQEPGILLQRVLEAKLLPAYLSVKRINIAMVDATIQLRSNTKQMTMQVGLRQPVYAEIELFSELAERVTSLNVSVRTNETASIQLPFLANPFSLSLQADARSNAGQAWQITGNSDFLSSEYAGSYVFAANFNPTERALVPLQKEVQLTQAELPAGTLRFEHGTLKVGTLSMQLLPSFTGVFTQLLQNSGKTTEPTVAEVRIKMQEQNIQELWNLIPAELTGSLAASRVSGALSLDGLLTVPRHWIESSTLDVEYTATDLHIHSLPAHDEIVKLDEAFEYQIHDAQGSLVRSIQIPSFRRPSLDWMLKHSERTRSWVVGQWADRDAARAAYGLAPYSAGKPGKSAATFASSASSAAAVNSVTPARAATANSAETMPGSVSVESAKNTMALPAYAYIPVEDISPYLVSAVLTAEDGDFFFHPGADWKNIATALARNAEDSSFSFGASTLSMQVVKNLFLSMEKTIARKLQETALVYLMEEHLHIPKERILELYLNIAEFGPGIYGAEQSARYYFGTAAAELSLAQALWLASILPSPRRYHAYFERGEISEGWLIRMHSIMDVMLERGRIGQDEYDAALADKPAFNLSYQKQ